MSDPIGPDDSRFSGMHFRVVHHRDFRLIDGSGDRIKSRNVRTFL